jgi:hypothetical protein
MSKRMETLLLYSRGYKDSVIALAEIHGPGEVAMLIRYQWCVLPKAGFFPQVLDHGDGSVVKRHCTLTRSAFQFAYLHIPA